MNITIYVDPELHAQVKAYNLPVSSICRAALKSRVRTMQRREPGGDLNPTA